MLLTYSPARSLSFRIYTLSYTYTDTQSSHKPPTYYHRVVLVYGWWNHSWQRYKWAQLEMNTFFFSPLSAQIHTHTQWSHLLCQYIVFKVRFSASIISTLGNTSDFTDQQPVCWFLFLPPLLLILLPLTFAHILLHWWLFYRNWDITL